MFKFEFFWNRLVNGKKLTGDVRLAENVSAKKKMPNCSICRRQFANSRFAKKTNIVFNTFILSAVKSRFAKSRFAELQFADLQFA